MPSAAASVPLTMGSSKIVGAPPIRIGSVSARCTGVTKPADLWTHQITTPPPNEKNDRKKLDAANAIDRPNTIWMSLRYPPEVSPNASDSPADDDDDDRDDLRDSTFDRLQDQIEAAAPTAC